MSAAITSSARPSWRQNLGHALTATVLTAVVVTPIFGLHLERAGVRTIITQLWSNVAWACLLVFIVQMLRPMLAGSGVRLARRTPVGQAAAVAPMKPADLTALAPRDSARPAASAAERREDYRYTARGVNCSLYPARCG